MSACACDVSESWHAYEWETAHLWMSHGIHLNDPCFTCKWVISHINESWYTCQWVKMSHGTLINESWNMAHLFMSHAYIWMSHVPHGNESCHTHHGTRKNESRHTVMSHISMRHAAHMTYSHHTIEWLSSWCLDDTVSSWSLSYSMWVRMSYTWHDRFPSHRPSCSSDL